MNYKVVAFHPSVTDRDSAEVAAKELEKVITEYAKDGWNFVALESMTTTVKPTGCNKLFNKQPSDSNLQLIVFNK